MFQNIYCAFLLFVASTLEELKIENRDLKFDDGCYVE
jgi:hypothetical protein